MLIWVHKPTSNLWIPFCFNLTAKTLYSNNKKLDWNQTIIHVKQPLNFWLLCIPSTIFPLEFFPHTIFFSKLNSSAPSRAGADENLNINSMWPKIASFHWQRQKCSFIRIVFSHKSTAEWMEYDLFGFTCQLLTLSPLSRISSALAPLTVQCTAIFSFLLMPKDLTV